MYIYIYRSTRIHELKLLEWWSTWTMNEWQKPNRHIELSQKVWSSSNYLGSSHSLPQVIQLIIVSGDIISYLRMDHGIAVVTGGSFVLHIGRHWYFPLLVWLGTAMVDPGQCKPCAWFWKAGKFLSRMDGPPLWHMGGDEKDVTSRLISRSVDVNQPGIFIDYTDRLLYQVSAMDLFLIGCTCKCVFISCWNFVKGRMFTLLCLEQEQAGWLEFSKVPCVYFPVTVRWEIMNNYPPWN